MKQSHRSLMLGLALLGAITASLMGDPEPGDAPQSVSAVRAPAAERATGSAGRAPQPAADLTARRFGPPVVDLFAARSGPARMAQAPAQASAPLPLPAASAPRAEAPALPFVYQGKLLEGDRVTAFLRLGPRTYLLRKGDAVADYRVVDIHAAGMTFVYLPLNLEQSLSFGSAH